MIVSGDLTIQGTTTTVNTETVTIQDNFIELNSNSATTPTENAGIEVNRGNQPFVDVRWNEGTDRWQFTNNGTTYYNIPESDEYMSSFVVEDGDGTEVTIGQSNELKFTEGTSININFTDVSPGSDADPFDLEISHKNVSRSDTTASNTNLAAQGQFSVVSAVNTNAQGHVTGVTTKPFTLPASAVPNNGLLDINEGALIDLTISGGDFTADKATETDITINVDLNELTDMGDGTAIVGTQDFLPILDNGVQKKKKISTITLSDFNNDLGWTSNTGDITQVNITAGVGLVGTKNTTTGNHIQTIKANLIDETLRSVTAESITTTADRTYAVMPDADGDLVVNVPWITPSAQTTFQVEDGDGTEVTISNGKEWKFVEAAASVSGSSNYININWVDTSHGSDTDPYDLAFSHNRTDRTDTADTGSVGFGGSFDVIDSVTTNPEGHITAVNVKSISIPANPNTDSNRFLLSTDTVDNGSDMILRYNMTNDGTNVSDSHDIGITAGTGITLTPGTDTFEIKSTTNLGFSRTSSSFELSSSNGSNITFPLADNNGPGLLSVGGHMLLSTIDANANENIAGTGISLTNNEKTINLAADQRLANDTDVYVGAGNTYTFFDNGTSGADKIRFYIDGDEDAYINEGGNFHARGDVTAFSSSVSSDVKLKENIEKVEGALEKVSQLDGVTFTWKKDGKASAGVIAQNVEKVLPSAVKDAESFDGEEMNKHVDYNQLSALFIEAIKELKEENKLLRDEIENLKSINS